MTGVYPSLRAEVLIYICICENPPGRVKKSIYLLLGENGTIEDT
jgi:hypothetical protein